MSEDFVEATSVAETVEWVIRERRTTKVLADEPLDIETDRDLIERVVASAGWAPFHLLAARVHRDEGTLKGIVPWRCHLLDAAACRRFRSWLLDRDDPATMPRLLGACTALVLVTWLPDPPAQAVASGVGAPLFEGTRENMEHVAAAAAVQNLLLSATARGLRTFWATGMPFRAPESFAYLGIPSREILLGAVFVTAPDVEGAAGVATKVSALRDRRGDPTAWSRWVDPGER